MKRAKPLSRRGHRVPSRYLTRGDVARLFGVAPATVTAWARQGRLGHIVTLGGHRRYRQEDILTLLTKAGHPGPTRTRRRHSR
jgi:excisionase family DNA binding protein